MNRWTFAVGPVPRLMLVLVGSIAIAIAMTPDAQAGAKRECATVSMETPFRLPNGLLYPAGALTLCDNRTFSPVDSIHKIFVGGASVGLFVSHRRNAELRAATSAEFVFRRGADGNLELVGYTMPKAGRSVAYRLRSQGPALQASAPFREGGVAAAPVAAIVAATGTQ